SIFSSYYLKRILEDVGITDNKTVNQINLSNTCWGFINSTCLAFLVYNWTIAAARYTIAHDKRASHAVLAFIYLYSPAYNMALTSETAYLVELFPFAVRSRGITIFQLWGRLAGFFNQYVNPIGIANVGWNCWLGFETSGRTLEELAFSAYSSLRGHTYLTFLNSTVFEGKEIKKRQVKETEQELDHRHLGAPMKFEPAAGGETKPEGEH
ncbi:16799_t:CDS:2, partial [Acaulospora colombiana]